METRGSVFSNIRVTISIGIPIGIILGFYIPTFFWVLLELEIGKLLLPFQQSI